MLHICNIARKSQLGRDCRLKARRRQTPIPSFHFLESSQFLGLLADSHSFKCSTMQDFTTLSLIESQSARAIFIFQKSTIRSYLSVSMNYFDWTRIARNLELVQLWLVTLRPLLLHGWRAALPDSVQHGRQSIHRQFYVAEFTIVACKLIYIWA